MDWESSLNQEDSSKKVLSSHYYQEDFWGDLWEDFWDNVFEDLGGHISIGLVDMIFRNIFEKKCPSNHSPVVAVGA